ncbi:MAG: hypothetical protein IPQ08_15480 [Chitinophagaceae bacterium]|nr:hypothetical protein [Chitinophagaceae bacterium]
MANVIYIPNGPANLQPLFPNVDFGSIAEYYVEVIGEFEIMATTPINKMECCCDSDKVRVHFLNYLGTFDAVNFEKPIVTHEAQSAEYKGSLAAPLIKTDTGFERFDVRANDTKVARNQCYQEENMPWLQELMDSPKTYEEWSGTQGQPANYLPIVIKDKSFEKLKNENDFRYDVLIEYKKSNEIITIRN